MEQGIDYPRLAKGSCSPDLVIRATRPGDCEEVAALTNLPGFRWGTLQLPYQSPEDVRKRIESRGPNDLGLVAVLEGRIVGNAGLSRYAGRRSQVASIGMGVHDDFRGRGIGSNLLHALLEAADSWLGINRVELTVYVDNAPAIALYRKNGFEIEGTHRGYALRNGAYIDAHAMARLRA